MKKGTKLLFVIAMTMTVMLAMSAAVFADEKTPADGTYKLKNITCSMAMIGNKLVKPATLIVDGENSTLILRATLADRYSEIYMGKYEEITEETKGIEGLVSGANYITFTIPLKTADLSGDLNCVVRYKAGYSEEHDHDWYKAKAGDYYLTLGEMTPVSATPLTITNNTGMFKAVKASIEQYEEQKNLVVALNGSGYENFFKGTYDAAVANGLEKGAWIGGYKNADGKIEFEIPLEADEKRMPIVAISKSHLAKVEAGEETIEECMFYRLFELDEEKKTIVTGDYYEENEIAVTNNVKMFKVNSPAKLFTVGAASSNNYSNMLTLTMGSDSYDKVKADTYTNYGGNMTVGDPVEIELAEGNVFKDIPVKDGVQILKFRSASKGVWYNRKLTMDLANKTAVFDSLTDEEEAAEAAKELNAAKAAAIKELEEAYDLTKYSGDELAKVQAAIEDGKTAINAAESTEAVAAAKDAAIAAAAEAKTDEQIAEEEKAAKEKKAIAKVKAAKVKSFKVKAGKKKVTFTWKKNTTFTGYQLKYKVGKKTKTVTIKSAKTVKKVIKKLKKKQKVYGQIRGYKKINGKTYYGKWAKTKTVRVK